MRGDVVLSGNSWGEFILILVIGLLILGPERLPRVASQLGRWVGKARRTANQLRFQLEREIAMADIEKAAKNKPKQAADSEGAQTTDSPSSDAAEGGHMDAPASANVDSQAATKDGAAASSEADKVPQ
jgi:sec-independent protein translocase protein TatB